MSAPAGFGKTTLLADWLHEEPDPNRRVAWLSLGTGDSEPATFWTYVVTALQGAVPGLGEAALELIASSPLPIDLALTTLLNDLAAAPGAVWLVLDDYHLVDNHDIGQAMAFLLEHLPPHVHVVLSTRADPDLPLARWRARGDVVEIRAADLRFTSAEAATYLDGATGLHLTADDVEVLEERTEGWIAALQLAALSIQGRDDVGGFIARFAGTDRYIVDYLVEEVLAHQGEAVREFLLHTCLLDRFTGPLCDAVVGRDGGRDLLTTLERANLFLVPLDDQREWFRYHHLFADVLRARLLAEQPDLVPLLHGRASRWFEAQGLTPDAVGHALAARDFDRAVNLIERSAPAIRRDWQDALMLGWLTLLPDDAVQRSPVLSVFSGYMLMVAGELDGAGARFDAAEGAMAAVPPGSVPPWGASEELRTLPATIAVYRASLAQAHGDVAGTAAHARRALALAGPDDHLARGSAAGLLGLAAWASGDVPGALETFTQAVASLHAAGNLVDEVTSTVVLADLQLAAGRPGTARRLYEHALQVARAQVPRAAPDLHVGLSELDREAGDLEAATRHMETAAAFDERASVTEGRYRWFVAMGRVAAAEGDPEQALDLLDQAETVYLRGFFPDVRPIAAMKARVQIACGTLAGAVDWARDRGVAATDEPSYLREFDHLTLVRLILAQHRAHPDPVALGQAADLLTKLRESAEAAGRAGSLVEIQLLTALVQDAQGRRSQALQSLADAWAHTPEPDGYARLFLDEGEPMAALLRDAVERGPGGEPARRLLGLDVPGKVDGSTHPASSSAEPLSERERQVLRLLDSDLTGPQIARELFVTLNTLRSHTKRIFTKLDVTSRRAAVRLARERGLL
ncbi:MAG: LuxR C-terminal-related transcriptional regulator [Cellulomonas sp.]|nr:LuxR C-terminal-related transcriptional regulator [Cellulomonas sp.]